MANGAANTTVSLTQLLEHGDRDVHLQALTIHLNSDDIHRLQSQSQAHSIPPSWTLPVTQALTKYKSLTHLTLKLPRLVPNECDTKAPITTTTLPTTADLWALLAERPSCVPLTELRLIATLDTKSAELYTTLNLTPPRLPPNLSALTFIATPAAAGSTSTAACDLHCPELSAAETALAQGNLSALCSPSEGETYVSARKAIDDLTALVHSGLVTLPRKPRPMPVYLTPREMEDRAGPPSFGRRLRRGLEDFADSFRPPGSERPGRTREEKARMRESDWRGNPGWSKSAFAERVVWRR